MIADGRLQRVPDRDGRLQREPDRDGRAQREPGPDGRAQREPGSDGWPHWELPAEARDEPRGGPGMSGPASAMRAIDLVKAPGELAGTVEQLLDGVLVAVDRRQGLELVRADPRLRVVTRDGDLIGAHWARGGSAGAPSRLGPRAAAREAAGRRAEARRRRARAGAGDKNGVATEATVGRNAEMEARLEVRTVEERLRAVAGRSDALASAAAAERQAIQRAKARAIRRAQEAAVADAVASGATIALAAIERSRAMADSDRQAAERASQTRDSELKGVRARIRELAAELHTPVSTPPSPQHRPPPPPLHLA